MKIGIIGAGGVGGYFGGTLAYAGYDVTFISRGEHLKALQENGLTGNSSSGGNTLWLAKITDVPWHGKHTDTDDVTNWFVKPVKN